VNLFADDTTLYLCKEDRMDNVERILDEWCKVSRAKFNMEKTEIIPIGTETHRNNVLTSRKINQLDSKTLDNRIRIAKDGDVVRSLGAWIGNHANDLTPWETIPTVFGKKLLIQAIIGGHTQFLTKAQGMPPHIEEALTKTIRDFIWDNDTHPRIALEHLYLPLKEGGLNLDLSPSRPSWATVTDILINAAAPPGTSAMATINTFLQTWDPPTKGPRAAKLNALRLSTRLKHALPAWYQPGAVNRPLTNVPTKCLLKNHQARTIADTHPSLHLPRMHPRQKRRLQKPSRVRP